MTVVVSDTSPILCLDHLQLIDILPKLFGAVLIPPAVARELSAPASGIVPVDASTLGFMTIRAPLDLDLVDELLLKLHQGEAEALALAVEVTPDVVLIDERTGRSIAKQLGLIPLGVLGTLVKAKRVGLVNLVSPLLGRLKSELDFRVSTAVEIQILDMAGESK